MPNPDIVDFERIINDENIFDDEPLLTRSRFAEENFRQMGCSSPLEAKTRLVSLAAQKKGPPYLKLGGISSPALMKLSWYKKWFQARHVRHEFPE